MIETEDKYARFLKVSRDIADIKSKQSLLEWDLETNVIGADSPKRIDLIGLLAVQSHEMTVGSEYVEALEALQDSADELGNVRATIVSDSLKDLRDIQKFDSEFVREYTLLTSEAQGVWKTAKDAADATEFLPYLKRIVEMKRREAEILGYKASPYDALLDAYDPGLTSESVARSLDDLSRFLNPFIDRLLASESHPDSSLARFSVPLERQRSVNRLLAGYLGFDHETGTIGETIHPFMNRITLGDVRIANRYHHHDALSGVYSTLHETGHALYEQGLPAEHYGTSGGEAASFGLHESQSRLWENIIGKSQSFWKWCAVFLEGHGALTPGLLSEDLWRSVNTVARSPVRIDADEVTYNLHICLRFEIEKALIEGTLEVEDVVEAWRVASKKHLGIEVKNDAEGVLQDSHWSAGYFGYFPSYAIGNLYAAQLAEAMRRDLPYMDDLIAKGEFELPLAWLRGQVHRHGGTLTADEIVLRATGSGLSADAFKRYIEKKYTEVYKL